MDLDDFDFVGGGDILRTHRSDNDGTKVNDVDVTNDEWELANNKAKNFRKQKGEAFKVNIKAEVHTTTVNEVDGTGHEGVLFKAIVSMRTQSRR